MSAAMPLLWRTLASCNDPDLFVKGKELAQAIVPDTRSRFALVEVRTFDGQHSGVRYSVRDAATVSDVEVREGKRPKQVASFDDLDAAIEWAQGAQ